MINISEAHLLLVKQILKKHLTGVEVRVFGSRLSSKVKKYSDLDLVIIGKDSIDSNIMAALKEEFEESDLPFRVDILDWHSVSGEFKEVINKKYEVLMKTNE